jgi:WhiB family redox-sensing transcriptional regulator
VKRTIPAAADTRWMDDAACRGADTSIFYDDATRRTAVAICNDCPVIDQCADYATRTSEQYGVWGGDTSRLRNNSRHPRTRNQNSTSPSAADRIHAALHPIQWVTPHAIAERTDLQPNTVSKTLRRLIDAGAPIEHLDGGWYRLAADLEVTA